MPKVSVIIPVYKVGKYIENSMKSVIAQQFKDFEVILVDNNTPDDSIEIAEKVLAGTGVDYRVVKQTIQGLPAARNMGIAEAKGEWCVSIDPDDTISDNFLEELYNASQKYETNLVFSKYDEVIEGHQFEFPQAYLEGKEEVYTKDEILMHLLTRRIPLMISNMFFKKTVFTDNNLKFDQDVILGADLILMWEILLTQEKVVYINKFMYNWFERANSLSTAPSENKLRSCTEGYNRMIKRVGERYDNPAIKWIGSRSAFGTCNLLAQHSDYSYFKRLRKEFYNADDYKNLCSFPDSKIRILNFFLNYAPCIFYSLIHGLKSSKSLWLIVDHLVRK